MPIECEAYAGPLDGIRFLVESPYVALYIRASCVGDADGQLVNWEHSYHPLPNSHRYFFHLIDDAGRHIYKPHPVCTH